MKLEVLGVLMMVKGVEGNQIRWRELRGSEGQYREGSREGVRELEGKGGSMGTEGSGREVRGGEGKGSRGSGRKWKWKGVKQE